ncbi:MAG: hypothetical protein ACE5J5_01925 [Candidatus Hydrothermarchaeales archaeon]
MAIDMGNEVDTEKKKVIECRHFYEAKEYKDGGDEVVHKHTVTVIQKR